MNASTSSPSQQLQQAINSTIDKECAVCYSEMILPTTIPSCGHKFCFICLKGVSVSNNGDCPICRGPIDSQIFKKPLQAVDLKMDIPGTPSAAAPDPVVKQEVDDEDVKPDVKKLQEELKKQQAAAAAQKMFWLYRGRHQGWWRFDPRIEKEIEEAFTHQMPMTEVTICGNPYIVDFSQMCQYPKNQSNYSRNVKYGSRLKVLKILAKIDRKSAF